MPLPVIDLDQIRVAAPCDADWSAMSGTERARFCDSCAQHVYDLSGMTRAEAEALVFGTEGRLCVRYFQRVDGTVLTSDCVRGTATRRRRRAIGSLGLALLSAIVTLPFVRRLIALQGSTTFDPKNLPGVQTVDHWVHPPVNGNKFMGKMVLPVHVSTAPAPPSPASATHPTPIAKAKQRGPKRV